MTPGRLAPVLLLLAALLLGTAAPMALRADQKDPRLADLFDRLKAAAATPLEARAIEGLIWRIWMTSDDAEVNRLMQRGVAAMTARELPAALEAFGRIVEIAPDFAEGWNKRATVLYLMGEYDASLADVDRTLALEPRHFGALSGLGLIHSALEQEEKALEAFERALAVNPHMANIEAEAAELRKRIKEREI